MSEFLLELFSEEIPARMQARAAEDLRHLVTEKLNAAGLTYGNADAFVTPRRLTLVVDDLPDKQPDVTEERKGPRVGSPDKAIEGFMKANGLDSIDEAEIRETEKGEFYFAVRHVPGRPTAEVLADLLTESVHALGWPKSMRWGRTKFRWVRPLHRVLALFAGKPLEGGLGLHGDKIAFTDSTIGHRFLAPEPVTAKDFADYRKKLEKAYVVLDPAERRKRIEADIETLAGAEDLSLRADAGLMDEVVGLVEWPVVLMGEIDREFMDLPPEVLTTSMRSHQKYFALEDKDGSLAPHFLVVANMPAEPGGERRANIVAGNERVLRARLADAKFFWDQDRKTRLYNRVPQLQDVIFHARLGSMHHKVDRIESLALEICHLLGKAERDHVRAAARLAKADLMTGMVGEFPELQGIMGKYYAADEGEPEDVARAIAEHYSPLGPNDSVPSAPVSVAVALADKIDTLAGFFAIGERPTGSKDPYALRRAALGIIRIIVENELRLPLAHVFAGAYRMLPSDAQQRLQSRVAVEATSGEELVEGEGRDRGGRKIGEPAADVVLHGERALATEVVAFLADRLKVVLRDRGVRHDLIAAVFAVEKPGGGPEDDLVRLLAKVRALDEFLGTDDGANLLVAYRRAANIVRIEAKKDDRSYTGEVQVDQLSEDEEKALQGALAKAVEKARAALEDEDFKAAMEVLAGLRKPVDDFFDTVTVNADDPALRRNRLRLLRRIEDTLEAVADFSKIEG